MDIAVFFSVSHYHCIKPKLNENDYDELYIIPVPL